MEQIIIQQKESTGIEDILVKSGVFLWKINFLNRTIELKPSRYDVDKICCIILPLRKFSKHILKEDVYLIINELRKILRDKNPKKVEFEARLKDISGEYSWYSFRGNITELVNETPSEICGVAYGIDDLMKRHENSFKLSYIDNLTGLFNRHYFDWQLEELNKNEEYPYSLIVADMNSLKLTNDAFGHSIGDKLIYKTAQIIRNSCREEDIVCRWGGDEFVIIAKETEEDGCEKIIRRINRSCEKTTIFNLKPSVSLGNFSVRNKTDARHALDIAEERMYKKKTREGKKIRMDLINEISVQLEVTGIESKEHQERTTDYCIRMARLSQLGINEITKLDLLCKYHDIGKIAIPDVLIKKKDKLTSKEWKIVKQHTEIGYRIAVSIPNITSVADEILCHHEMYDGTGYPNGLKEDEIPLVARIFSIVDAFDIMVSGGAYKLGITQDDAINELRKYSGMQFDPDIVNLFIEMIETADNKILQQLELINLE